MDTNTEKIYGTYTGFLTSDGLNKVTNGTELELYITINSIGGMIWRMRHDSFHGRLNLTKEMSKDLIEAQYSVEFAVLHSRRFGVEIPEPTNNEHVKRTDSYNKWFSWWNNYIQYTLSEEEYKELESLMDNNQDYSQFRPEGNWNA